jgi:hypothetical protein
MKTEEELKKQLQDLQISAQKVRDELAEIEKRKKQIEYQQNLKLVEKSKALLDIIATSGLLDHMKHDRLSCSDENPRNSYIDGYDGNEPYADCKKCLLMQIIEDRDWDDRWIIRLEPHFTDISK